MSFIDFPEFGTGPDFLQVAAKRRRKRRSPPTAEQIKAWDEQQAAYEAASASRETEQFLLIERHREPLRAIGLQIPIGSGRSTFATIGCVAALLGIISQGAVSRDEIVVAMRNRYRYSYRHAGFLLTKYTGPDAQQHLWFKDDSGLFHLHETGGGSELSKAA